MGKHIHVELKDTDRVELERLMRSGNSSARKQTRARILLLSDRSQGQKRTDPEVATAVMCSRGTVRNIRRRYVGGGLSAALNDKGWPGAKPKLTGELEAQLVMLACSEPPKGYARWTLRLLANCMVELGYIDDISHVTVREWLKKTRSSLGK
jgi:transposase